MARVKEKVWHAREGYVAEVEFDDTDQDAPTIVKKSDMDPDWRKRMLKEEAEGKRR